MSVKANQKSINKFMRNFRLILRINKNFFYIYNLFKKNNKNIKNNINTKKNIIFKI